MSEPVLEAAERAVRTSFRISDAAREKLEQLAASNGHSMKAEIGLIALDLFHQDPEFARSLNEFIARTLVPSSATRKSQAVTSDALELINRKAEDLGVPRDQVVQQAILFRSAVSAFSEDLHARLEEATAQLAVLDGEARRAYTRVLDLLGPGHFLVHGVETIVEILERLYPRVMSRDDHSLPSR